MKKLKICVAALLVVLCCILFSGCSMFEQVSYEFIGSGEESWNQAALESGVISQIEEYYYEHLPDTLHEAYREIFVRIMRNEDSGTFLSNISVDDFWKVYYAVLSDHPEIFWLGISAQIEESGLTGMVVSYDFQTIVPEEARSSMQEQLEATANECIYSIPEGATDYEKIKFVYEYLIQTVDYDSNSADSQSIQSALLYHHSVCAGYSKAFAYILHRMGMFCTYVTGQIQGGGEHGWNMVRIDGKYYYVDVTWGDPVFSNQIDQEAASDMINYNYLCCTEKELFLTHIPDGSVSLPECNSDDYNYYKLNGYYYEWFDWDTIYNALMNSVWNGESGIVMKFGNPEAYDTAVYELFEDGMLNDAGQYLMEINGVSSWNYRYHVDDKFLLITIYWK